MIFGTQTTIDAGTYPRLLTERGVDPARIISQACPGLADTISEDRQGERTRAEALRTDARTRFRGDPSLALLGRDARR